MRNAPFTRLPAGLLLLVWLAVILSAGTAWAQTLSLRAPAIADENGSLTVRFGVSVVELPVLKGELEDGAELALKCMVKLFKVREYWLDGSVASGSFESVIRFDRLAQEFVMTVPGRTVPLRNGNLPALLSEGWGTIRTVLGPWSMLEHGQNYSLRLITTMNEVDAPEGLERFLYFWSWDAGSDNTFHLNFTF
ncbi:DUF4390 domain-containing protein [Pseudodesulfovibrio cashew]|uniref:DUF4390 domain-containing protein n=1 Tax=Pseudodesulfovibrio cashew TaxID=2678688 RepID=A0A6I6JEJ3_9BACT|nr:DUF4390 domain-containing protein [Pseudodesulfovibrio cashew]QGY39428.1 DUF4390 domain-containing protein [Pseudodesulfovibrio cashew]